MEKLAMCRICLTEDVRLRLIANTHLQEVYESLTLLPLETKDSRPIQACYICCAGLQNCYRLRKRCLRSEELLTQILSSDWLQPINVQEGCTQRLIVDHPVIHLSIGDVVQNDTDDDTTEDSAYRTEATDVFDHDTVKQEDNEDIKTELQEEHDVQIDDDIQYSHLEGPLDVMKREPDDVETDTEDIKLEIEDITIEENEPNSAGQSTLSTYNICPKIVKVVLERTVLTDTIPATGVPALKKLEESESLSVTETENANKSIVVDKLICDVCSKCFTYKSSLIQHMYTHTDMTRLQCNVSYKRFTKKYNLTRHIYPHTGQKRFQCDVCNKRFTLKYYLTRHMFSHTDKKQFQCDVCNKRYMRITNLTQHMVTHNGEKLFQCDVCNKRFTRKTNLTQHKFTHNGEKLFQCDVCNKRFTLKSGLTQHMFTHTDMKRFQCDECKKCFPQKCNLTKHMFTHTDNKRFQCDVCNKHFTRKYDLTQHMFTHNDKKQFQCDVCIKRFTHRRYLTQHMFTHTDKKQFSVMYVTNALRINVI